MPVIIRLQGLPWSASALDIRRFFDKLSIPDGGVHIVGGEKGDAFIAFSSDDDARRGMMMSGHRLSGVTVTLFLSSRTEMQTVIDQARGISLAKGFDQPQGHSRPGMKPPYSSLKQSRGAAHLSGMLGAASNLGSSVQQQSFQQPSFQQSAITGMMMGGITPQQQLFPTTQQMPPQQQSPFQQQLSMGLNGAAGMSTQMQHQPPFGNLQMPTPVIEQKMCVECYGFEPASTYKVVRYFFGDDRLKVSHDGIKIAVDASGNLTGSYFVKFDNVIGYQNALKLNRTMYRGNMIKVYPCLEREWIQAIDKSEIKKGGQIVNLPGGARGMRGPQGFPRQQRDRSPVRRLTSVPMLPAGGSIELNCVVIRGLPPSFDKKNAFPFTSRAAGCIMSTLYIEFDVLGRCMGRLFLEFNSAQQAQNAIVLGVFNPFEATLISRNDMQECLKSHKETVNKLKRNPRSLANNRPAFGGGRNVAVVFAKNPPSIPLKAISPCVRIDNLPPQLGASGLMKSFGGFQLAAKEAVLLCFDGTRKQPNHALLEFSSEDICQRAIRKFEGATFSGLTIALTPLTMEERNQQREAYFEERRARLKKDESTTKANSTKVVISKLPDGIRAAAVEDIFLSYGVVTGSVMLKSAIHTATMGFLSKDDADLAVQELNGKMIMGSTVELKLV